MRSPLCTQGNYTDDSGNVEIRLTFDTAMDQAVTPPLSSLEILEVTPPVYNPTGASWLNSTVLSLSTGETYPPATPCVLQYTAFSNLLQSAAGVRVQPFTVNCTSL